MSDYNGWTNRATWLVNLWINDERSSYLFWKAEAKRIKKPGVLADVLRYRVENESPLVTGMYADLLNTALSQVNWDEIAQHLLEE